MARAFFFRFRWTPHPHVRSPPTMTLGSRPCVPPARMDRPPRASPTRRVGHAERRAAGGDPPVGAHARGGARPLGTAAPRRAAPSSHGGSYRWSCASPLPAAAGGPPPFQTLSMGARAAAPGPPPPPSRQQRVSRPQTRRRGKKKKKKKRKPQLTTIATTPATPTAAATPVLPTATPPPAAVRSVSRRPRRGRRPVRRMSPCRRGPSPVPAHSGPRLGGPVQRTRDRASVRSPAAALRRGGPPKARPPGLCGWSTPAGRLRCRGLEPRRPRRWAPPPPPAPQPRFFAAAAAA